MSVTDAGYSAPRGADFLELMIDELESSLNITLPRTSDNATYQLLVVMSLRLAELSEATQALYDMRDSNNATGSHLRNNGALVGVYPLPATKSEVVLTLDGIAGTVVPAGALVRDSLGQTWGTVSSVILPGETNALSAEFGEIRGFSGNINEIITIISGWESVTNASPAQLGRALETDSQFRLRRAQSLQVVGGGSPAAIRSILIQQLDFISKVAIIDNDTSAPITVAGYTIPSGGALISVFPEVVLIENSEALAIKIWELLTSGTELVGDVEKSIIGLDGQTKDIRWHNAEIEFVRVDVELVIAPGFGLSDFQIKIEQITLDYFNNLQIGEPVRRLQLASRIAALPGLISVVIQFNSLDSDFTPQPINYSFPFPIYVTEA